MAANANPDRPHPSMATDIQHVAHISNCLSHLIAVGTITFYDVPTYTCGFESTRAPQSSYKWFDAGFLKWHFGHEALHPILKALIQLINGRYVLSTYRVVPIACNPQIRIWKVRVYVIPLDLDGSRHLRLWRQKNGIALSARQFSKLWTRLISGIDFNSASWRSRSMARDISDLGQCLVPFFANESLKIRDSINNQRRHIQRWFKGERSLSLLEETEPLEKVIDRIYANVRLPDLSQYENKIPLDYGVPYASELIVETLGLYASGGNAIEGVETRLYPFQIRSVCKMYEKETVLRNEPVPHYIKLSSPLGQVYYYDSMLPGIYLKPELFSLPRGGILAENMGFGKTLICLSLICLSNHETSVASNSMKLVPSHSSENTRSLAQICAETINQNSLPWKYYKHILNPLLIQKILAQPAKYQLIEPASAPLYKSRRRVEEEEKPRELYLCNTTLIIVPENLFHQWNSELKKHVKKDFLRVLYISRRFKTPIEFSSSLYTNEAPSAEIIVTYDLVIITAPLFAKSDDVNDVFVKVYWKRLIVDEGHSMSSRNSVLSTKCNSLFAERRWAVTGTPTSGLTSLHMDEDSESIVDQTKGHKHNSFVVKKKFNVRDDLFKLGTLVSQFFKIEPFFSQSKLWTNSIIKRLTSEDSVAAQSNLLNLLDSIMIRHSQADVQKDLRLPRLHHEAVFLEPSYQNRLAINLFNAVLAVNAVSSERTGPDYMFSTRSRPQLRQLVLNLRFAAFYWTGFKIDIVEGLRDNAIEHLQKVKSDGTPRYCEEDLQLLRQSLTVANKALDNARWRMASDFHEMQYFVADVPPTVRRHFASGSIGETQIYSAPQLRALQEFYYKNRFTNFQDSVGFEAKVLEASREFWTNFYNTIYQRNRKPSKKDVIIDLKKVEQLLDDVAHQSGPNFSYPFKDRDAQEIPHLTRSQDWKLPKEDFSRFKYAQILGTASTKLSYLSCKLVSHARNGIKSIVFFENEDSAYFLAELLELLGVPFILYANFIGTEKRANHLKDFSEHDTSQSGITLIMDLNLAAHGLTIISATHVYFMSAVWRRSVEAQAIKRAHRIGQTQDVYVETLILRGTLEEEMYRIRSRDVELEGNAAKQASSSESGKSVIDNDEIRNFVAKFFFLKMTDNEKEYSPFVLPRGHCTSHDEERSEDESDEYGLPDHCIVSDRKESGSNELWCMRAFNPGNLQRLEDMQREQATTQRLNMELVNPVEKRPQSKETSNRPHKRVKF